MSTSTTLIPMADYVRDEVNAPVPTLNSGTAHRLITRSPLHAAFGHPKLNPLWEERTSDAFDLGAAAHAVLLENDAEKIAICEFDSWRTNAAKEFRESARAAGRIPLMADDATRALAIVESAKKAMARCPDLEGIGDLDAEQTLVWQDAGTGAWLRCRTDWISTDRKIIVSFKTTANAEPEKFIRSMVDFGYAMQSAFELNGTAAIYRTRPKVVYVVSENTAPYATSLIGLAPEWIELAQEQFEAAVAKWAFCLANNSWPGYPKRIAYVEPPSWAWMQWESRKPAENRRPRADFLPFEPEGDEE